MRKEYKPLRKIRGNVANGMNRGKGGRFGRVSEAFSHSSVYYGDRSDWYIVAAVNRDSDTVERSNWDSMLRLVGGESDTVAIERANHWACGWVDYLLIHPHNRQALREAIYAHSSLSNYPILDESHHSELEEEECRETWEKCYDPRDRVRYFREHSYSKNAAFSDLRKAVRGDWYAAASLLNCPIDLIY